jgi:hypothetical protein
MKCRLDDSQPAIIFSGVMFLKQVSCKTASCCTKSEALSLLLMENLTSATLNPLPAEKPYQRPSPTKLHQLVVGICLRNPFWNDFRLLSFFAKRNMELTLKDLQQLRRDCNVDSKVSVCHTLMEMYFANPKQLSPQQIGFIERINPPFCDRNITSSAPGKLLFYECIFIRRLSRKIMECCICISLLISITAMCLVNSARNAQ